MKVLSVDIKNFFSIGEATLELADKGLILIQGENLDDPSASSNGSGKSSMGDAISWCLFNQTARGVSGDSVINREAGKGCRVAVTVEDDGKFYRIARNRKNGTFKNNLTVSVWEKDDEAVEITKGTDKLTQELVEKIVGCSFEVFKAAVYSGQESLPNLPAMTDKELKLIVEEAAGINQLQACFDIAKKRAAVVANEVAIIKTTILTAERQLEISNADLIDVQTKAAAFGEGKALRLAEALAEYTDEVKRVGELRDSVTKEDWSAVEAEIETLESALRATDAEKRNLKALEDTRNATQRAVDQAADRLALVRNEAIKLSVKLKVVDDQIGQPCGECGKAYCEDDLHTVKNGIKISLKTAADKLREHQTLLETARNALLSATDGVESFTATMTDVSKTATVLSAAKGKIAWLKSQQAAIVSADKVITAILKRKEGIEAEVNVYEEQGKKGEERIALAETRLKELNELLADLVKKQAVLGHAVNVYGPAGVRAHILDTVTPFLNDRTAYYLGSLSDGVISASWETLSTTAKGEVREKFQIAVDKRLGADEFAGLSGGEKRKVRLSCALALQDLVASRASKPIDLWIGDEIDDALDDSGLERLMGVLEVKARERGTVLIVSHADLKDWCRNVITVTIKDGRSTITEGL